MKRNTLYTVNKWNKSAFMPKENFFALGSSLLNFKPAQLSQNALNAANLQATNQAVTSKLGSLGSSKVGGSLLGAAVNAGAGLVGGLANSAISGGLSSGAGSTISSLGSTIGGAVGSVNPILGAGISIGSQVLGGVTNALFGESVDEAALAEANEGTAALNNFTSNASTFDEVKGPEAVANVKDVYKGGLFNDVSGKNEELKRQRREAQLFADRSVSNNINNLISNQNSNLLANFSAYGGPLDFGGGALGIMQSDKYLAAIDNRTNALANRSNNTGAYSGGAKTFDFGGLKSAFLDEFGSDPIGAAIRYNQGLERLEAQREAEAVEAAREAEYNSMQQRLAGLETRNQGLEALLAAQPTNTVVPEVPEPSSTSSEAAPRTSSGNSNWDYIENQLRKSGKFNDVQIEGIKYNLQRESGINPDVVGDNGQAYGLAQWHGARRPKDMSLEGQTKHLISTLLNYDNGMHWIGKNNYYGFLNARTPEEAHYYIAKGYERPAQRIVDKVKRDSDMSLKRLKAFGGELGTNGTDFTNGLLYIDEGGTHEENPLEGVPIGLDPQGIPNLVEEGETVYNDYVFSDRMKVPGFMYKELGLGGVVKKKGKEMSFADASKKLAQESEQRPNDPISLAGLNASLSRLAEVQEAERMKHQAEEYRGLEGYACGGRVHRFDYGGALKWLQENQPRMANKEAVAKALSNYIDSNPTSFYKTTGLKGGISNEIDYGIAYNRLSGGGEDNFNTWVANGLDRRLAFSLTHPEPTKPKNSDLMHDYNEKVNARNQAWERLVRDADKTQQTTQTERPATQQAAVSVGLPADYNPNRYAAELERRRAANKAATQKTATELSAVHESTIVDEALEDSRNNRRKRRASSSTSSTATNTGSSSNRDSDRDYGASVTTSTTLPPFGISNTEVPEWLAGNIPAQKGSGVKGLEEIARDKGVEVTQNGTSLNKTPQLASERNGIYDTGEGSGYVDSWWSRTFGGNDDGTYVTWMRYAPAIGAGIMTVTDALGLTNRPDYTYADKLEAAAQRAGYAPNISYNPIGNYLTYRPLDIWYEQNRLNANSRATDRAIMNSGANQGSKAAALLASGYNDQLASGNLYRQAVESNIAQQHQVADFNRRTNMFNSQMGLEADMANARYRQQAQQMGLSGLAQAAALREDIDKRIGASRSANLTNFLNSLGNIGRENFALNQLKGASAAHNGYYGDTSGRVKRNNPAAFGGRIKKRK